jgi:hypothetical protein
MFLLVLVHSFILTFLMFKKDWVILQLKSLSFLDVGI